jgi:DNA-binding LytR/AlgR family response regulator
LTIPAEIRARPSALFVSGLFSAEVYWDGELLGRKGHPGTRGSEVAGPIDAAFFLPPELLRGDTHDLTLRVSATRNLYRPNAFSHGIYIAPYRPDERRPITSYLPALMLGGLILGLGLLHLLTTAPHRWLYALAAFGLLIGLSAEASRAIIDYPYNWHPLRLGLVVLGFAGFTLPLLAARLTKERRRVWLVTLTGLFAIAVIFLSGFDNKAASVVLLGMCAIAIASAASRGWAHPQTVLAVVLAVCALVLERIDQIAFLDSWIYMLGVVAIADELEFERFFPPVTRVFEARFRIRSPRGDVYVPFGKIIMITSEGDGVMVHLSGGELLYHSERIGEVESSLPPEFMRVHRSTVVNLPRIRRLTSEPGSKYVAELDTGAEVRVARSYVPVLRDRLESGTVTADRPPV